MKLYKIEFIDDHQTLTYFSNNEIYGKGKGLEYEKLLEQDITSRLKKEIKGEVDILVMEIGETELKMFDMIFSNINEKSLDLYAERVNTIMGDKINIIEYGKRTSIVLTMNIIFGIVLFPQYESIIISVGIMLLFFPLIIQKTMKSYKNQIDTFLHHLDFKRGLTEEELVKFGHDWKYYKNRNNSLDLALIDFKDKRRN